MIKVSVADVVEKKIGDTRHCIIVLLDEENQRLLMIWVGPEAGVPIALNLLEHSMPRPMTFTFMANLLKATGVELKAVCVDALKEDVFYATARIRHGDTVQEIDARPSDAINLALCMGSPIYVTETVMEAAGIDIPKENALPSGIGLDLIEQEIKKREQELEEKKRAEAMLPEVEQEKRKDKYEESKQELVAFVLGTET
jgi:bifunctional DNase/RNase